MDMYVVGLYKRGKSIEGFRLLAINADYTTETRDESYMNVFNVIKSGRATIKNLKIENNKLKGVNGSLDRYGILGKTQALVILEQIQDQSGNTTGYFCSDASGRVKDLSESEVLKLGNQYSIANGKIVSESNGVQHVSCIEGTYKVRTKQSAPSNKQSQKVDTLSSDMLLFIAKLESNPNFTSQLGKNIIATIKKTNRCSEKQKAALDKIYKDMQDVANGSVKLPSDVQKIINELKTYKEYSTDRCKDIVNTVESTQRCTENQKKALTNALFKLKVKGTKLQTAPKVVITPSAPNANTTNSAMTASGNANNTVAKNNNTSSNVGSNNVINGNNSTTNIPASLSNNQATKYKNIARKIDRENELSDKKVQDELSKEFRNTQLKLNSLKEKRALTQNIQSDGLYDYSLTKDGRAYIEGFTKDQFSSDVITPDTVTIDGNTYKVTGINIGAFSTEPIISVVASSNINDIGQRAFAGCTQLKSVDLSRSSHNMIPAHAFRDCSWLTDIKIGDNVQRIHEGAFYHCKALEEVTLPASCDTIAREAFSYCTKLKTCSNQVKTIDALAFYNCKLLDTFDFSNINSIGPQSFRKTGFIRLHLPSNVSTLGEKAFADCYKLQFVEMEEGVKELGNFCFGKSGFPLADENNTQGLDKVCINEIKAPKSLNLIGIDAFRHTHLVIGWAGSVAESKCISFGTPFKRIDSVNKDNSTAVRLKAKLFGTNPIDILNKTITTDKVGASNPDYKLNTEKLVDIPFNTDQLAFFNLDVANGFIEPHIKFKAAVNYLQDVSSLLQSPLSNGILRLQDTFYTKTKLLYDDGCNKICKVTYQIMDTLESGSFMMVLMNNSLRYITDCNLYTDITMTSVCETDKNVPVQKFLHSGDIIGEVSTISGHAGISKDGALIGYKLYKLMYDNGIDIMTTKRDDFLYIPCDNIVVSLHDKRGDKMDGEEATKNECKSVIELLTYDDFLKELKKIKKNVGGSEKFFSGLSRLSSNEVSTRIKSIGTIEDEKEAQLFQVSKQFDKIVDNTDNKIPTPNLLTYNLFCELATSYWMVSKDESWLQSTGRKSLNRTAEYHIENYRLTEYKSNQIVKFSNPYMNGQKGAYIFTLTSNNSVLGVFASRYTMQHIVDKLYALTKIPDNTEIPDAIMVDPDNFDKLSPGLFYTFYDVLYSKNGWGYGIFTKYNRGGYSAQFNISMYKPTGVFYLTMSRVSNIPDPKDSSKKIIRANRVIPILPIGNMDRALMVATTTNTNAKDTDLYEELMSLSAYFEKLDRMLFVSGSEHNQQLLASKNKYTQARKLAIAGVKDVSQYKALISDRVVYMLGTVHKGVLQREHEEANSDIDDLDIDSIDDFEIEIGSNEVNTIDETADDDNDLGDFEINIDDEDDTEDEYNDEYSQFVSTANSMGITDESQIHAMYINFKSMQN